MAHYALTSEGGLEIQISLLLLFGNRGLPAFPSKTLITQK